MRHGIALALLTTTAALPRPMRRAASLLRVFRRSASSAAAKPRCVLLNAARLDFDGRVDFASLEAVADVVRYEVTSPEDVAARCAGAQIVVNKELPLDAATIAGLPDSVALLCEAGTGYNNIHLATCLSKDIQVANVPTYATQAMAHMAITLVMALACSLWRQGVAFGKGDRSVLEQSHLGALPHVELTGKTLGLVGGRGLIGREVAKIGVALGMRVVVASSSAAPGEDDDGVVVMALDDLLAEADFVSIHCPLSDATRGLVGARQLARMKPTAFLVNTARGAIVDQAALVAALSERNIAGAALDVFGEGSAPPPCLPADHPLYGLDNVMLTPHIGWQRVESRQRVVDMVSENIAAFLRGEPANIDLDTGLPRR